MRFSLEDITLKEAWTGPAALGLFPHALCDVARLPVREVVSALHFKADLTLGLGSGGVRLYEEVTESIGRSAPSLLAQRPVALAVSN